MRSAEALGIGEAEGSRAVLYRMTISRGASILVSLSWETDDEAQSVKRAQREFDTHRSQRKATSVTLNNDDGKVVYAFP